MFKLASKDDEITIQGIMLSLVNNCVDIVQKTCLTPSDVVSTLDLLGMLVKNGNGDYVVRINTEAVKEFCEGYEKKGYMVLKRENLKWKEG